MPRWLNPIPLLLRRPALAIFLVTVLIRSAMLFSIPESDLLFGHATAQGFRSTEEGISVAVSLATTGRFADPYGEPTGPTAHLPPAYPVVTAGIYRVFGFGRTAALVRNGLNIVGLGVLYASFPAAAGALEIGAASGAFAGFGAALVPVFRSSEVFRGRDEWACALGLLWLTVLLFRMCRQEQSRLRDAVLYGAGWGVLLLVQPSTVLVLAAHGVIWLVRMDRSDMRRRLAHGFVAAGVTVLLILPWMVRNRVVLGEWFFLRDNLGLELRGAYDDRAAATQYENLTSGWFPSIHPSYSAAAREEIRRDGEVKFNQRLSREAHTWIAAHPRRAIELTLSRAVVFWVDLWESPPTFLLRTLWSLAAWVGLVLLWRHGYRFQALLFAIVLVVFPPVYYVVPYSNRRVVGICFAIFLPAGYTAYQIYRRSQRARQR